MTTEDPDDAEPGPWNPDIKSTLPAKYLSLSTLFRPENVFTSIETVTELSDFTGFPIQQLICFRPERLVVHELLIRVSADIFVSDGSKYEDLGINYRKIVGVILRQYIEPHMEQIVARFDELGAQVHDMVETELAISLFAEKAGVEQNQNPTGFARLFKPKPKKLKTVDSETPEMREQRIVSGWQQKADSADALLDAVVYGMLAKVAKAIIVKHGRLLGDKPLLTRLVSGFVCNDQGSEIIGDLIAPYIQQAAAKQAYPVLPAQSEPVVINIKGASAAGKSTMRPLQHRQTDILGLNWHDFALISPDIWRKYLLDYDSLGPAYKYAGTLAGDEIPIIDAKLDRYIANKARQGRVSHLLIDRFRFDSFAPGHDTEEGSNLLTRFGHTVYLTFIVTPPEATVERAWIRGLRVGRYKSVDDLLDHNIEAFNGIPVIFFTWALNKKKTVYYEFLDNSVAYGEKPRTIAFGSHGELYIYNFKNMLDIVRYTKINIEATSPMEVYSDGNKMSAGANTDFLVACARKISVINFVERQSGLIYARMEGGKICWANHQLARQILNDSDTRAGFLAIASEMINDLSQIPDQASKPVPAEVLHHTMGDTGP
ncbi:MAG: hypothetical protein O6703_03400 [Gammaproteobacteria bacterium]|nr:hypothetical protein [Gammaproteobacteria bacterium]